MAKAGVPEPMRKPRTKPEIALEEIDRLTEAAIDAVNLARRKSGVVRQRTDYASLGLDAKLIALAPRRPAHLDPVAYPRGSKVDVKTTLAA